ncbi:MAG: NTP transferase domain-containing protein [Candidatus Omnitrophica bacterium]|nr:NTP transferase domain-containing protein [Candidatus Omnitrophota bacterium]
MKALIIAAGKGRRLEGLTKDEPKPLIKLLGLSLIERVILTARQAGIDEFVIVAGFLGEKIKEGLGNGERYGVKISYIENREWQRGNGVSALKAKESLNENFVLLMSDHIFDERILRELLNYDTRSSVVLAVDRRKPLSGDTKVLEEGGRIVKIGKNIRESNCIDTGIFLCSAKIFSYIEEAVKEEREELADGIANAAKNLDAEIFDITQIESYASKMRKEIKPWWIDIDTKKDLIRAREIIIENASKNPSDALACYVHKPIENRLVAWISNFNITPNQLTIIVNILAYTVTALFFFGYLLPGSILTFVVGIADGLDGKLARVKLKTSKIGSLEHSFDLLFEFSWFIALSWFLFNSTQSATPLILCMFIILFIAFYRHIYDQFRRAMGKSLDDAGNFERKFRRIAGRRNLYNIPILVSILLGVPLYSLFFILFHSGITAIVYSARAMRHMYVMDSKGI